MTNPGFFLYAHGRKVFAAEQIVPEGVRVPVIRGEHPKARIALIAIKLIPHFRDLRSAADAVAAAVKPYGYRAFYADGHAAAAPRICVMPEPKQGASA
jgi:hypothetical protein